MEWDNRAAIITVGFLTAVLFLLMFFGFTTKLPLPGEEGILVNFGDDETGFGVVEPRPNEDIIKEEQVKKIETVKTPEKEAALTQDYEDAPAIKMPKKTEKTTIKKEDQKIVKEEQPKEQKPVVDSRALFGQNNKTTYSGSEGVTSGTGNQGSVNGDVNSDNHSVGGGAGQGISFNLNGRSSVALPSPEFNHQKEGRVVVQITVDRSGRVTNAIPGVKGSTTLDNYLLEVAKNAALISKFNTSEEAPIYQSGTIEYVFRLR
jgi:TonB family protein